MFIVPVLLGDGTRLFEHPGGTNIKLERLRMTAARRMTSLRLRVLR